MNDSLMTTIRRLFPDADHIEIQSVEAIPGGFSRQTFRFDARIVRGGQEETLPFILRKDPPPAASILQTSRQVEHDLIETVRSSTGIPVSRSYGVETDLDVFGEHAMVLERMPGSGMTSNLFNGGIHEDQADDVVRHLCELLVELHSTPIERLNPNGALDDPRGAGIDVSSWDRYIDTTADYYIRGYSEGDFVPAPVLLDAYLSVKRDKPRPGPLAVIHGDFNPVNFLYENGKVTAVIDWENARVGDPREDLGWMQTMDLLSNTKVMEHPRSEGGFLAYYNRLTGRDITQEEINYFSLFGTCNIAVPVAAAFKRRVLKEHMSLIVLYILQPSVVNFLNFATMLRYPGIA